MLPAEPPSSTPIAARRGDKGWLVYAIQRGVRVTPDGDFGARTHAAVKDYQRAKGLTVDGVAGPRTQEHIALDALRIAEARVGTPRGLMRGLAISESGMMLAAVNWTVSGGVDCGVVQRRVYRPFSLSALKEAFDPAHSSAEALSVLAERAHSFAVKGRPGEREWRLAALAHNWPAGAADIARDGRLSNPDGAASWVAPGTRFHDGVPVRTRQDWVEFYALGGKHGEGMVTRFVTSWT